MADDLDRLASAVAQRFSASQQTAKLASAGNPSLGAGTSSRPTLLQRLASAVGQRLARGSQLPRIEPLASAVAERLAASPGVARLASATTRHYSLHDLDRVASASINRLGTATTAKK